MLGGGSEDGGTSSCNSKNGRKKRASSNIPYFTAPKRDMLPLPSLRVLMTKTEPKINSMTVMIPRKIDRLVAWKKLFESGIRDRMKDGTTRTRSNLPIPVLVRRKGPRSFPG